MSDWFLADKGWFNHTHFIHIAVTFSNNSYVIIGHMAASKECRTLGVYQTEDSAQEAFQGIIKQIS